MSGRKRRQNPCGSAYDDLFDGELSQSGPKLKILDFNDAIKAEDAVIGDCKASSPVTTRK